MENRNQLAPEGQIWVCGACGKTARDRHGGKGATHGWDVSCFLYAVLCFEEKNEDGNYVAVPEEEIDADASAPATS